VGNIGVKINNWIVIKIIFEIEIRKKTINTELKGIGFSNRSFILKSKNLGTF